MRYFIYIPTGENSSAFSPESLKDGSALRFYDTRPRLPEWSPLQVVTDGDPSSFNDFPPFLGPTPLFSPKAWESLKDFLGSSVEALPVTTESGIPLLAIHAMTIVEGAIDLTRSEHAINSYSKSVSWIRKYALNLERLAGLHFFKMEETKGLYVYMSEDFMSLCETLGLVGLKGVAINPV